MESLYNIYEEWLNGIGLNIPQGYNRGKKKTEFRLEFIQQLKEKQNEIVHVLWRVFYTLKNIFFFIIF